MRLYVIAEQAAVRAALAQAHAVGDGRGERRHRAVVPRRHRPHAGRGGVPDRAARHTHLLDRDTARYAVYIYI